MIDLKGYDDVQEAMPGEFVKFPAGGYICRVVNAKITNSKAGNPMLVLFVDVAEGDFKDFFRKAADRVKNFNPALEWDNSAVYRQLIFGNDGKVSRFFKGLLTCFRLSNPNDFTFNPHSFDEQRLRGQLIGFVFAEEEYQKRDGSVGSRVTIKFPKQVADIRDNNFSVPDIKKLTPSSPIEKKDDFAGAAVPDYDVPF